MWSVKWETRKLSMGSNVPDYTWDEPCLEKNDGTTVRRTGGSTRRGELFEYQGSVGFGKITFEFIAISADGDEYTLAEDYQVGLSQLFHSPHVDADDAENTMILFRCVMKDIREALTLCAELDGRKEDGKVEHRPVKIVTFAMSVWDRWPEFKDFDFGEIVI